MHKQDSELMLEKINQLVDDQLPPPEKAEAMARLENDPLAQETRQAWQAQREALRALHRPLLDDPISETLLAAARRSQLGRQQIDQGWRWGGMAAAVVLAFGVGWLSHGQLGGLDTPPMAFGPRQQVQSFIRQASVAHEVYSPEVRHPVDGVRRTAGESDAMAV